MGVTFASLSYPTAINGIDYNHKLTFLRDLVPNHFYSLITHASNIIMIYVIKFPLLLYMFGPQRLTES